MSYSDVIKPWFTHIDERVESIVGDLDDLNSPNYTTRNAGLLALGFANLYMGPEEGGFGFLTAIDDRAEAIARLGSAEDVSNFIHYFSVIGEREKATRLLRILCLKRLFVLKEESGDDWLVDSKAADVFLGVKQAAVASSHRFEIRLQF